MRSRTGITTSERPAPPNNALKLTRGEGGSHSSGAPSRASRARGILCRRAQLNAVFGRQDEGQRDASRRARGASSTTEVTMVVNRSAPRATVVPILVYEDVGKAIDWLCDTFGFRERLRAGPPAGSVTHAQLDIGEGAIMLGRQGAEF